MFPPTMTSRHNPNRSTHAAYAPNSDSEGDVIFINNNNNARHHPMDVPRSRSPASSLSPTTHRRARAIIPEVEQDHHDGDDNDVTATATNMDIASNPNSSSHYHHHHHYYHHHHRQERLNAMNGGDAIMPESNNRNEQTRRRKKATNGSHATIPLYHSNNNTHLHPHANGYKDTKVAYRRRRSNNGNRHREHNLNQGQDLHKRRSYMTIVLRILICGLGGVILIYIACFYQLVNMDSTYIDVESIIHSKTEHSTNDGHLNELGSEHKEFGTMGEGNLHETQKHVPSSLMSLQSNQNPEPLPRSIQIFDMKAYNQAPPPASDAGNHSVNHYAKEWDASKREGKMKQERRRRRTIPPSLMWNTHGNGDTLDAVDEAWCKPYSFDFLSSPAPPKDAKTARNENDNPTNPHQYHPFTGCSLTAKSAHESNPTSYPPLHALTSSSVVLITGVLSRLGFHLAMYLSTQCNVQILLGIDNMFPNESSYRLRLLDQISLLYTHIPNFQRPVIMSYNGIVPKKVYHQSYAKKGVLDDETGDLDYGVWLDANVHKTVTHVVHLLSAEEGAFTSSGSDYGDGVYGVDNGIFGMRQSLMATENLMSILGKGNGGGTSGGGDGGADVSVHLTFVSDLDVLPSRQYGNTSDGSDSKDEGVKNPRQEIHTATKQMEEIIIQSYAQRMDHSFVTLRMPTIYGPWGKPGAFDHDLVRKAMVHWHDKGTMERDSDAANESMLLPLTGLSSVGHVERDVLFVDDAVNAIVTAMQYRKPDSNYATFNILSGEKASASTMADMIESYMPISTHLKQKPRTDTIHNRAGEYIPPALSELALDHLHWTPKTFLRQGIVKTIAWHLDEHLPFGSQKEIAPDLATSLEEESGENEAMTKRVVMATTETGHAFLNREHESLCNADDSYCLRGHRVLPCASECADPILCKASPLDKIVAMTRELTAGCETVLYTSITSKGTSELSISSPIEEDAANCNIAFILKSSILAKHLTLNPKHTIEMGNGEFLSVHKGWKIIQIGITSEEIEASAELRYLIKLSPGRLFDPYVKQAVYLSEDFPMSPSQEDKQFTTDLLRRREKANTSYQSHKEMRKLQYTPGKTKREALLLLPSIRKDNDPQAVINGLAPTITDKIPLRDAISQITEGGEGERKIRSTAHIQFQNQIHTFFNRCEFAISCPTSYKFILQHWIRRNWVVHNLEREAARVLRCEWYKEHTKWENENEGLSFAQVMTRLEIRRFNNLVDEEKKDEMLKEQSDKLLDDSTDEYEWFGTGISDLYSTEETGYVRIVDEKAMIAERRLWNMKNRKSH